MIRRMRPQRTRLYCTVLSITACPRPSVPIRRMECCRAPSQGRGALCPAVREGQIHAPFVVVAKAPVRRPVDRPAAAARLRCAALSDRRAARHARCPRRELSADLPPPPRLPSQGQDGRTQDEHHQQPQRHLETGQNQRHSVRCGRGCGEFGFNVDAAERFEWAAFSASART